MPQTLHKIEKGIPLPTSKGPTLTSIMRALKVGDSFLTDSSANTITGSASHLGIKVSMRLQPDGTRRVWRTK